MQLLAYNPKKDEFFVGMSQDEFEQAAKKCSINDGHSFNYEDEVKNALEKCKDEWYNELIRKMYQCDEIPFICVVTDRDFHKVSIRPKHFPFGHMWNGYSPWKSIVMKEIEPFKPITINIEYKDF